MQFEIKIFLIFGSVMLIVILMGSGSLSFEEANSKADEYETSLSSSQLNELVKNQANFAEIAFPPCINSTGTAPSHFKIVIEIGADGYVTRSWRKGNSRFVICFQKSITDYFFYWPTEQSFFTSFEHTDAS